MSSRDHYIYITAARLECYRDVHGMLIQAVVIAIPRSLSIDGKMLKRSVAEFETHLARYPYDRYFVVTDTQAEAYQAETVPVLSARDLRLLLTRKLAQRYRTTNYRAVVPHRKRRFASLRRWLVRRPPATTRILYALIGPEALAPWLDALERRHMNVRGLYSLGALMPALIRRLKMPVRSDLLIVLRTAAGYRHAFVAPSGLRFSRLCPFSNDGEGQVGQEIDKTLQYLTMARLWGVQSRHRDLHIAVIDSQPSAIALQVPGNNLRPVELRQYRPSELPASAPPSLMDATNSAWLLLNRAAVREHGSGCAASLTLREASRRADYGRLAGWGTAAAAAASLAYLSMAELAVSEDNQRASTAELIAEHVNASADKAEAAVPKTDLEPDQQRALVETRNRLLARSISALGILERTALALAPFPALDIDSLEWSYTGNAIVLAVAGHADAGLLKADANHAVVGLADSLARQLDGQTRVDKLPFDIEPDGTLASKPGDVASPVEFSVTVAVPPKGEHAS